MRWFSEDNSLGGVTTLVTVTATALLDATQTASVSYSIAVTKNCLVQIITPPEVEDHYYKIGDPQTGYQIPLFGNTDEEFCPLTYEWDYDVAMTSWTYLDIEPRTLNWNSYSNVYSGVYTVGMIASNEAGVTARVEYLIYVDPSCGAQTVSAPLSLESVVVYTVSDPVAGYEVPEFETNDIYCPIVYEHTSQSVQSFMTELSGRHMQWEVTDNALVGQYTIEVVATGPDGATAAASYTLDVQVNCLQ